MSINKINELNLQLGENGKISFANSTDSAELRQGQEEYFVNLTGDFSNIVAGTIILTDGKHEIKEMNYAEFTNNTCKFGIKSPKVFKAGAIIEIGFIFQSVSGQFSTTFLEVTMVEAPDVTNVGDYYDPEEVGLDLTNLNNNLLKLTGGKVIEKIKIIKDNGAPNLQITYKGGETQIIGPLYTLEDLDLITSSGGGQLGSQATATRGFAGGYKTNTTQGVAIGQQANSHRGVSIGPGAFSSLSNIAIGGSANAGFSVTKGDNNDSYLGGNGNGNIAIGVAAKVRYGDADGKNGKIGPLNNITIGTGSFLNNTKNCISIGSGSNSFNNPTNSVPYFDTNCTNGAKESESAILIGTNVMEFYNNYGILIGSNIRSTKTYYEDPGSDGAIGKTYFNHISIGSKSISGERSCIAIGTDAQAGCLLKEKDGNIHRYSSYKNYLETSEPAAIAIGKGSKAIGHTTVSLGKFAKTYSGNAIAIGHSAVAGVEYDADNRPDDRLTDGSGINAIAIGYAAAALKDGAVQIGPGVNSTPQSLQFGCGPKQGNTNVVIVKDGAVQFDLSGQGAQGVLPVEKGGTGAKTREAARENLGIYIGGKTKTIEGNKYRYGEMTIPYSHKKFTAAPHLFLNLRIISGDVSPTLFNYYVKTVTKDQATIVVEYKGNEDTKKNSKITFGFYVLAIGDGVNT